MGLRQLAESDLGTILEDSVTGFGWQIVVISPDGELQAAMTGSSDDIAQVIDPDTGQAVSGRLASVALRTSSIYAAGFTELPQGIDDSTVTPWLILFNDINGQPYKFKVVQSNPDRTIGLVTCILELYR